jgi:hypothetical protein
LTKRDLSKNLVDYLKTEHVITIIVCIIGTTALILAPIIYDIYKSSVSKPDIETYLEFNNDPYCNILDFKVKNVGEQTSILRSVEIEVLNYSVDNNPILKRGLSNTKFENNRISYLLKNFGWGPALNVSITGTNVYEIDFYSQPESDPINHRFYEKSNITENFGIKFNEPLWTGDITAGNSVEIQHNLIDNISIYSINDSNFDIYYSNNTTYYSFYDRVEYYDLYGYKRTEFIAYAIFEVNGSFYGPELGGGAGAPLNVSRNYNGILSTNNDCPYIVKIPISHELKPNEVDRFSMKLDTDKTSNFDVKVYLIYDNEKIYIQDGQLRFFKEIGVTDQNNPYGYLSLLNQDIWQ